MKIIEEFKQFAVKGNAIDLAIGVVIGASFNDIVNSIVKDVITPAIGLLGGKPDFSSLTLFGSIKIGNFLNVLISFLIVAFTLFLIVKAINKLKNITPVKKEEPIIKT